MADFPYFAFVDESGVLSNDPTQPFFALGLLLIEDTSRLHQQLRLIRSRAIAAMGVPGRSFEFKFADITAGTKQHYKDLIDVALSYPDVRVCVFVLDKTNPRIRVGRFFRSTWDAYISYLSLVVRNNVTDDKKCIIIADDLTKPVSSTKFLESELKSLSMVENATLLESHASLFIQLIDVLCGCVVYQFKQSRISGLPIKMSKMEVSNHLMVKLGVSSLAHKFTVERPVYFNVWNFCPKMYWRIIV